MIVVVGCAALWLIQIKYVIGCQRRDNSMVGWSEVIGCAARVTDGFQGCRWHCKSTLRTLTVMLCGGSETVGLEMAALTQRQ